MMRVMVALALPALVSGVTCSQDLCCSSISGQCRGNDGGTGDVVCGAGKINKALGTVGTDAAACCDDAITGKCEGNTGGTGDVACGAGKINKGVGTAGTDAATCCETACVATLCVAANGDTTKAGFATIVGADTTACCDDVITGMCTGNTGGTGDVACGTGKVLVDLPSASPGTDEATCCEDINGKCTGNTDGTGDVVCVTGKINRGVGTAGTDAATCCLDACTAAVCTGDGMAPKAGFATIANGYPNAPTLAHLSCCDVTGMCQGNTVATANFDCSATSIATFGLGNKLCTPAVKAATSGAATATVAASALALVAALL